MKPIEIERKYLIEKPGLIWLSCHRHEAYVIEQTYLKSDPSSTLRIRKEVHNGITHYSKTEKKRITSVSCFEDEDEIYEGEYDRLLKEEKREGSATIYKTRYKIPFQNHLLEIDIYPFLTDYAVLEIELKSEGEEITFPLDLTIVKEITSDFRFKNTQLANWLFQHPNEIFDV